MTGAFYTNVFPESDAWKLTQKPMTELRKNGVKPASVEGFGPVAPVACNTSDEGLSKNRRVEVWLQ